MKYNLVALVSTLTVLSSISVVNAQEVTYQLDESGLYSNRSEINFNQFVPKGFGNQSLEGEGSINISEDGSTLTILGNNWQYIDVDYLVTTNTVVEFDVNIAAMTEIQGIGFDNDTSASSETSFKVSGSQDWGISDYSYTTYENTQRMAIPVGQHFTGFFTNLVFIADNDATLTGDIEFSNVLIYENEGYFEVPEQATWQSVALTLYGDEQAAYPLKAQLINKYTLVAGEQIAAQDLPSTLSELNIYDDDNDGLDDDWETTYFGNLEQSGDDDFDGDGFSNFQEWLNGSHPALTTSELLEDALTQPLTGLVELDASELAVISSQDEAATGDFVVAEDGTGLQIAGNRWLALAHPYTVTENTQLAFDLEIRSAVEIHGIAFVNALKVNEPTTFNFSGSQDWGIEYSSYTESAGKRHYKLDVADYFSGSYQYLTFISDDDANLGADIEFSNIYLYEKDQLPEASYQVSEEDSWESIAEQLYGDPALGTALAEQLSAQYDLSTSPQIPLSALPTSLTELEEQDPGTDPGDGSGEDPVEPPVDQPVIGAGDSSVRYEYDPTFGLVSKIDGPRTDVNDVTYFEYEQDTGYLSSVTNALGHSIHYSDYHDYFDAGLPGSIDDENGNHINLFYTEQGWLESVTQSGYNASYEYDDIGLMTAVTIQGVRTEFSYDDARYLRHISYANGTQKELQYDLMGNVTSVIISAVGKSSVITDYEYDELGRLTDILTGNATHSLSYDENSNATDQTNGYQATSSSQYDSLNRLTQQVDELNAIIDYTYNELDQITSVTDDNGARTDYIYDGLGRLTDLNSPDTGATNYQYDDAGNPTQIIDARGQRSVLKYDALNRLVEKQYEGASDENVDFIYDASINAVGKLSHVHNSVAGISFSYDNLGRLTEQHNNLNTDNISASSVTSYGYDTVGVLNRITYPSGLVVNYEVNALGEVSGVNISGDNLAAENIASDITYSVLGHLKSLNYGNGIQLSRDFASTGQPTSQSVLGFTESIQPYTDIWGLTYSYDANNNLAVISNSALDLEYDFNSTNYGYYANNRLQHESNGTSHFDYEFDGVGNRLLREGSEVSESYNYVMQSNLLQALNGNAFSYDEAGNMLTSGVSGQSYSYNAAGRLSEANVSGVTSSYLYNGLNERVVKQLGDETYLYFYNPAGQLLETQYYQGAEKVSSQQIIWLANTPIAQVDNKNGQAELVYIHTDHLNAPRKASNTQGQLVWQWSSDAYGNGEPEQDVDQNGLETQISLRFPGQIYDGESGLYYNYYRYYDPQLGRYITSDPIGLNGGINTYAYVGGNPVGYVDPLGLSHSLAFRGGWAIGGGINYAITAITGVSLGVHIYNAINDDTSNLDTDSASNDSCPGDPSGDPDCDKINKEVQNAKNEFLKFKGIGAACKSGMSRWELTIRKDSWLRLARARSQSIQRCWNGGDETHQDQTAQAWKHVQQCSQLL